MIERSLLNSVLDQFRDIGTRIKDGLVYLTTLSTLVDSVVKKANPSMDRPIRGYIDGLVYLTTLVIGYSRVRNKGYWGYCVT